MHKACLFVLTIAALSVSLGSCASNDRTGRGAVCDPACVASLQTCCMVSGTAACVQSVNDPNNCGGCGIVCPSGACSSGTCTAATDSGLPRSDGSPPGMCSPTCPSNQRCCGSSCVNRSITSGTEGRTDSSFQNCNGCGIACDPTRASACSTPLGMGGRPECLCGDFMQCNAGEACAPAGMAFSCVNLQTDRNNCGSLGNVCGGDETCTAGVCGCGTGITCGPGTTCCGASCIATANDTANCGGCGVACGAGETCTAGACSCGGMTCRPAMGGMFPAMPDLGETCCAGSCVPNSNTDCGGCGVACTGGDTCIVNSGGILPGGMAGGVCCGQDLLFITLCTGGGLPGGDGGLPGLDGGFPFP